ncbi:MAG: hypothetical protein ACFFDW_06080 [Candidatus Thorarchaeota archaeon]
MTISNNLPKTLSREESFLKIKKISFCSDCAIDWCKIRNEVTYCSQKYKGESCYSCSDGTCSVKRVAGS